MAVGYRLTGEAAWPAQIHDTKAAVRWIRAHAESYGLDADGQPMIEDDAVIGLLGGSSAQKPAEARAASPITYVSADDPSFLAFHGTGDRRVDVRHAERIHAALQGAGVPSLLVLITGGNHGSVTVPDVFVRGLQFADRILRGQAVVVDTSPIAAPDPIPALEPSR